MRSHQFKKKKKKKKERDEDILPKYTFLISCLP